MTKITVNDISTLVREEVIKLKNIITAKQASKLNLKNLCMENIYDKLTGDSTSLEAIRLLNKCAKPYSGDMNVLKWPNYNNFDQKYTQNLFSPLEIFCYIANNSQLKIVIGYLQGNVTDLYLNRFFNSLKRK